MLLRCTRHSPWGSCEPTYEGLKERYSQSPVPRRNRCEPTYEGLKGGGVLVFYTTRLGLRAYL